ncbi:hypothetical protein GCM10029964_111920 [Kibdelosporangium lantanae]
MTAPIRMAILELLGSLSVSRETRPVRDWLPSQNTGPIRIGSPTTVIVQKCQASLAEMTNINPWSPTNVANARTAADRRPITSRYATKINGVSLTAAATPTSTPPHFPARPVAVASTSTSTTTRNIRIRLICPRNSVRHTGSTTSPRNDAQIVALCGFSQLGRCGTLSSTIRTTMVIDSTETAPRTPQATTVGRKVSGTNSRAPVGGYVNGSWAHHGSAPRVMPS